MRAVIDFEVMVYTKNVLDTDLHIKNIILVGGGAKEPCFLIDLGSVNVSSSDVNGMNDSSGRWLHNCSLACISPLLRWHKACNPPILTTGLIGTGSPGSTKNISTLP